MTDGPSLIERLNLAADKLDTVFHKSLAAGMCLREAASTLEDQARLIGECREVLQAVMQERRGYFVLVDALLTKLNAFGERDE